jgi:hypothetical protein
MNNNIDPEEESACKLVDTFAIVVQILMAIGALSALLYKRAIEKPQRSILIWSMDTSKQVIAASIVHFTNILLAYLATFIPQSSTNPCVWYFLNLLMDCTIGVYILHIFLKGLNRVASRIGITGIKMGHYGSPPRFMPWFKQLILFLTAWFWVKIIVGFALFAVPIFSILGTWVLSPIADDKRAQIVFVMFLFPLCMNIIQGNYFIIQLG